MDYSAAASLILFLILWARIRKVDGIPANVRVMPIQDVDATFGSNLDAESDPRQVIGRHEVIAMLANKAGALGNKYISQHCMFMDIAHEQSVAVFRRKRVR